MYLYMYLYLNFLDILFIKGGNDEREKSCNNIFFIVTDN